jgi:sugar phosphate isomerase/epimerase
MAYTRREFGTIALAGISGAAALRSSEASLSALAQTKPDSLIDGVQIGAITYSYRSMADQSAEATLKYIVDSGISSIELMGGPVESFAGAPASARPGGPGRGPGGPLPAPLPAALKGTWAGKPCALPGDMPAAPGRARPQLTPEQQAAQQEQASKLKAWRTSVSMDAFKELRRVYNNAGVTIYAWKQMSPTMSDDELEYIFHVAEALGCTHTTLELPTAAAQLKRIGDFAMKKKVYAAYHTHTQGSMTAFDQAFELSKGNMANVDFGHWVAAGNVGGTPMQFLEKHHGRVASFHLKDRTTAEHCALNLPWGTGETPIREILQMVRRNKWKMPGSVELEYDIPEGSDAVKEVRKCVDYCRSALAS